MTNSSNFRSLLGLATIFASISACGGGQQQPAAETPAPSAPSEKPAEPAPSEGAEPSSTEGSGATEQGEHAMPDGGEMPGHHHSE